MMTTGRTSERRGGVAVWAAFWCLYLTAGPLAPAWAQRREAEPEANPSFQEDTQGGPPGAGAPIGGEEPAGGDQQIGGNESGGEPPPMDEPPEEGGVFPPSPRRPNVGQRPAPAPAPAPPTNPLDTRIVVRVKNAPLSTFLDTISAQAKVNFIITEGLEAKRITAFLQNVTVREALQILLEIKGLTYQRIGRSNTYVVSPRAEGVPNRITRIYTLNYIPLVRVDAGSSDFTPGGGTSSAAATPTPAAGGAAAPKEDTGGIAVVTVIRSVLTEKFGKITVDARTNAIIITDIPEVFPQVEQILAELDRKAPQVIIEAQIVEINSDRAQQLGIEWGGSSGEFGKYTGPIRDSTFPLNLPKNLAHTHFFDPLSEVLSSLSGGATPPPLAVAENGFSSRVQSGLLDMTSFSVVLRALVTRAEARFLGKPKILTLNNRPALIQVATSQAVAFSQESSQSAGGSTAGNKPERFSTGLNLKVTPQVNREGYITMLVEPSFTNVVESKISTPSIPVFDPTTRAASTLVRVKNGQTLVLGGLLESRETKAVRKVPFLGYIPLIGWLFTSKSTQRTNTDLVIFITPTIVTD